MSDRHLAEIICAALLAIVAGIRKKYGLPNHQNIDIVILEKPEEIRMPVGYNVEVER